MVTPTVKALNELLSTVQLDLGWYINVNSVCRTRVIRKHKGPNLEPMYIRLLTKQLTFKHREYGEFKVKLGSSRTWQSTRQRQSFSLHDWAVITTIGFSCDSDTRKLYNVLRFLEQRPLMHNLWMIERSYE